jgi:uncharacterized membrane protein YqjE
VDEGQPDASRASGLLASLRGLAGDAVGLLHTRLELLIAEIEEERAWIVRLLILSVIASFFLAIGVLTLTIFIILLAWESHGLLVAGALTAIYLGIGVAFALSVRKLTLSRPKLFSASLAELRKDKNELAS